LEFNRTRVKKYLRMSQVTKLLSLLLVIGGGGSMRSYVSHTFQFPAIPQSAGIYHIHSPLHFMEVHGFSLPGFKLLETSKPETKWDYVITEFTYKTHFGGITTARMFSNALNTSHVLLMDTDKTPCLLGKLTVKKCASSGLQVQAHANLLRPATAWERMMGGDHLVNEKEVERAIKLGYSNFKNDLNLKLHVQMVLDHAKK
jgi:hypothetical protein